jgi:hypothetical protein
VTVQLQYTLQVNGRSNNFTSSCAFVTCTGRFSSIVVLYNDCVSSSDFVASNVIVTGEK